MSKLFQGDIIKISGYKTLFIIISNNTFINSLNLFHVIPFLSDENEGPIHISLKGKNDTSGIAICEQIKIIDPTERSCQRVDRISYGDLMDVSDAISGIFEYD